MEVDDFEPVLTGSAAEFSKRTEGIPDTLGSVDEALPDGTTLPVEDAPPVGGALTTDVLQMTFEQLSKAVAKTIKDGAFWEFQREECVELAKVWHPILGPLWDRWMGETNGALLPALMVTAMSLAPRVIQEMGRRASLTASMATAKSGDLSSSADLPEAENPLRETA